MCVNHIPSPEKNASSKIESLYTGPTDTELAESMINCDPDVSPCTIFLHGIHNEYALVQMFS